MGSLSTALQRGSRAMYRVLLSLALLLVAMLEVASAPAAYAGALTVNGITFSDRLGGFVLEKASGVLREHFQMLK